MPLVTAVAIAEALKEKMNPNVVFVVWVRKTSTPICKTLTFNENAYYFHEIRLISVPPADSRKCKHKLSNRSWSSPVKLLKQIILLFFLFMLLNFFIFGLKKVQNSGVCKHTTVLPSGCSDFISQADALKRIDTVHTYKVTFQGKKTTRSIIPQCHKHIHTYGRIARKGCWSRMFFSWGAAAANSHLLVIGLRGLGVPSKI